MHVITRAILQPILAGNFSHSLNLGVVNISFRTNQEFIKTEFECFVLRYSKTKETPASIADRRREVFRERERSSFNLPAGEKYLLFDFEEAKFNYNCPSSTLLQRVQFMGAFQARVVSGYIQAFLSEWNNFLLRCFPRFTVCVQTSIESRLQRREKFSRSYIGATKVEQDIL